MNQPLTRMIQHRPIAANVSRGLVHSIPLLTGLAMGWQWLGLSVILASAVNPSSGGRMMLATVLLLAAALGPWLPERIVLSVLRFIERNRHGMADSDADAAANFWMLRAIRDRDQALLWLSLSVLGCIAGVLAMFTLLVSKWVFHAYDLLLEQFFWNHLTLSALEWFTVTAWLGMTWVINGLVIATLSPVMGTQGHAQRDLGGVSAGVIGGLGFACILHRKWADAGLSGHQTYLLGALTIFGVAAICAWLSQRAGRVTEPAVNAENDAPEFSARGESLIWLSLVSWGTAATLVSMGWLHAKAIITSAEDENLGAGGFLVLLSLGVWLASFHARRRSASASGCGMALWAAGVGAAIVSTIVAVQPSSTARHWLEACLLAIPAGYALHYAERAWLARVGSETIGFAQMITAIFGGLAVGLIVGYWWLLPQSGPIGTICAGSLLMLGLGGFVQIHERNRPVHTQHLRLAMVFASLAAVTFLFPADVRRWSAATRANRLSQNHFAGLDSAILQQLLSSRSACFIQSEPHSFARHLPVTALAGRSIEILPLGLPMPESDERDPASGVRMSDPVTWLSLEDRDFDLIYQRGFDSPVIERYGEYSVEWFTLLNEHLSPGGQLYVDAPLENLSKEAVATIALTFARAAQGSTGWMRVDLDGNSFLRMRAGDTVLAADQAPDYMDMQSLCMELNGAPTHSLSRDRITRAVWPNSDSTALHSWLDRCRSHNLARLAP